MATSETEAGVDVVSKQPSKEAELRYRISVDDSGTKATLASITAIRANDAVDGGSLVFSTDAVGGEVTGRLVIDPQGNVGIGTENPGARLEVAGDVKLNGPLNVQGALAVSGVTEIRGDLSVTGKLSAVSFAGDGAGLSNITPADASVTNAKLAQDAASLAKVSGGSMAAGSGNIGIGTENPVSKLHILSGASDVLPPRLQSSANPSFAAGWDFYHEDTPKGYVGVPGSETGIAPGEMLVFGAAATKTSLWAGGNRSVTVDTNGNVGIGTTSPDRPLAIKAVNASQELISFKDPNGATRWHINQNLNGTLAGLNFVESGVADGRLFLKAGGNVGIATVNPQRKLQIGGRCDRLKFRPGELSECRCLAFRRQYRMETSFWPLP